MWKDPKVVAKAAAPQPAGLTPDQIAELINAGEITVTAIISAWKKIQANRQELPPLSQLFQEGEAADDETIALEQQRLADQQ